MKGDNDIKALINVEIYKAIKVLAGEMGDTLAVILAISEYSPEEVVSALRQLGAKSDLTRIVRSWGGTQDDSWVLDHLRRWNAKHAPPREGRRPEI